MTINQAASGDKPRAIHFINAYSHSAVSSTVAYFQMDNEGVHEMLRDAFIRIVELLDSKGIDYRELQPALVPRPNRFEIAFVFDSRAIASGDYGYEISKAWIPALRDVGPSKTAVHHGDIIGLPSSTVWELLERDMIRPADFPRQSSELYYVVYMSNLSRAQRDALDDQLTLTSSAYLGYVDCSAWTPLKAAFPLPQVALRHDSQILTSTDDGGTANQIGYPFEDYGFQVVGIDDVYSPIFLESRIDMGNASWREEDSRIAFNALGPSGGDLANLTLEIDEARFRYLSSEVPGVGHGRSLRAAGLGGLDREQLTEAILTEIKKGLLFNLRAVRGSREVEGKRRYDEALDALMFNVQVSFQDDSGNAKRLFFAVKYIPGDHRGEVVTLFG